MALVSTEWLRKNIFNKNIKILDCSWHMPDTGRIGKNEFEIAHIPGSIFFDLDEFSVKGDVLPHTLLSDKLFSEMIGEIGISNNDHIIVCMIAWERLVRQEYGGCFFIMVIQMFLF